MNETSPIQLKSEADMNSIYNFLSNSSEITMLPCDDPFRGLGGFVAFRGNGDEEKHLFFGWQYANPALKTEYGSDYDVEEAETDMMRCLSEPDWVKADDPKRRFVGFIKHKPVGSVASSHAVLFDLGIVKKMSMDTRDRLTAWRETS